MAVMGETPKAWRIWNGKMCKMQFQWEPRNVWVGLFWRSTELCLHFYVCIVPLLPLHITITTYARMRRMQQNQE